MRSFVRNLSAPAEFCLVVLIAFGLPILANIFVIIRMLMNVAPRPVRFGDHTMIVLLIAEAVTFMVIFGIGHIRGWASETFRFQVTWRWTVMGFLLYVAAMLVAVLAHHFALEFGVNPTGPSHVHMGEGATLPFIILNSITNPVFEEMLEAAYIISSLHKIGMWPAILAGALLRMCLHVYLGFYGASIVMATGVIFGLVYWRWRQLWPLIVAHALLDFLGLMHMDIFRLLQLTNHGA